MLIFTISVFDMKEKLCKKFIRYMIINLLYPNRYIDFRGIEAVKLVQRRTMGAAFDLSADIDFMKAI